MSRGEERIDHLMRKEIEKRDVRVRICVCREEQRSVCDGEGQRKKEER